MSYKTLTVCAICIVLIFPIVISGTQLKRPGQQHSYWRRQVKHSKTGKALRTDLPDSSENTIVDTPAEAEADESPQPNTDPTSETDINDNAESDTTDSDESPDDSNIPQDANGSDESNGPHDANGPNDASGPSDASGPDDSNFPQEASGPEEAYGPEGANGPEDLSTLSIGADKYSRGHCKIKLDVETQMNSLKEMASNVNFGGLNDNELTDAIRKALLQTRGVAQRESHAHDGDALAVPAGTNLGGHCTLKIDDVFLFFHRMKLRNSTYFTLHAISNNLKDMILNAEIGMNDIHLMGSYERMLIEKTDTHLFYHPSFGIAEFLLKGVMYTLEARYRAAAMNRINVELIVSSITFTDSLLVLQGFQNETKTMPLQTKDIDLFIERLRADMDEWIKDFINDALNPEFSGIKRYYESTDILDYDQKKLLSLNKFSEDVIKSISKQLSPKISLPDCSIVSVNGMRINLRSGELLNLQNMYRRSSTTYYNQNVELMLGFSDLKIIYAYSIRTAPMKKPVTGYIYYSANDVAAHMMINAQEVLVDVIQHLSTPTVSIQGPGNKVIAAYRHLLEHQILAIFTNIIQNMIESLVGCLTGNSRAVLSSSEENNKNTSIQETNGHHLDPTIQVVNHIVEGIKDFKDKPSDDLSKTDSSTSDENETDSHDDSQNKETNASH